MIPILSIVIPTYARPNQLKATVKALIPQIGKDISIIILDNSSPIPASVVLEEFSESNIRIVRNDINIGGNANIAKCFTVCETEWMWLLGDDDLPAADAIETIRKAITKANEKTVLINFSLAGWCVHKEKRTITSYEELLQTFSNPSVIGNCLFISASVCRAQNYREYVKIGHHYTTTCATNLVMTLLQVRDGKSITLSQDSLITSIDRPVESYSKMMVLAGIYGILDIADLRSPGLYTAINALAKSFILYRHEVTAILIAAKPDELRYWSYFFIKLGYFEDHGSKLKYFLYGAIAAASRIFPGILVLLEKVRRHRSSNPIIEVNPYNRI